MDLILCHTTADFDTLGAAVGLTRLHPGARIVLTGGAHPTVRDFLALHRDEYALIERRSVNPDHIRSLIVVDTQWRDRLGKAAEWLDLPDVKIITYDHHCDTEGDIPATQRYVDSVGAATTLVVERLMESAHSSLLSLLTPSEATVMALGIHVDTGSLTYDHATVRDAAALTWLMAQGANLQAIAEYVEPGLSPTMQDLLTVALDELQTEIVQGYQLSWVLLSVEEYIPGLSNLASHLLSLTEADVLLLAARYAVGGGEERLTVIGRSHSRGEWRFDSQEGVDLGELFRPFGGGGHARAAALTARGVDPEKTLAEVLEQLRSQIPHPPVARELMSSPVRTIRPDTTIQEAQRILLRYGHSGLSVVDAEGALVGIISRRDLDIALHHGFSHARVKGYMTTNLRTITPDTPLTEIESLMMTYDIGRLPVLEAGHLVGIVTRTDVLRQLHREKAIGESGREEREERREERGARKKQNWRDYCVLPGTVQQMLRDRLANSLWDVLMAAAKQAEERGWQLYLVGGAVRDLFLSDLAAATTDEGDDRFEEGANLFMADIDLVVDGFHRAADHAAGVELARALQQQYPSVRLQIHGRFQTSALTWHNDPTLNSLWIDIATARTEFYPYPAANPEVEASSIRQDLYRRDFTINAMAIRLTAPRSGEVLDFFGGLLDLQEQHVRVLHANSFIEDPTRIYRAVRFAVRLGFEIDPQTEGYIRHAIASGVYHRIQTEMAKFPALQTRLKQELRYILEAPYWTRAIQRLSDLGAICCIHSDLQLTDRLWWQLRLVDRWLRQFDTDHQVEHWLTLLEVLLAELEKSDRVKVAENLQLPADSIDRLQNLDEMQQYLQSHLPKCDRPSQLYQALIPYDLPTLVLLAVLVPRSIRRQIWQYLTRLAPVKPLLNGNDLKALGYKPGRQFKPMLEALLAVTLDGEVRDRTEAEQFIRDRFPLEAHKK
ncbi:CBS domain-containing protein [Egbenema bharatensis]|uniref:CBS domain-containing protein n=1 Tax=Egbenema bharatensis TaxID=3463334 RepID=UPI003A888BD8